jgi:hypothetical protein
LYKKGILNAELLGIWLSNNYSSLPFTFDYLPWKLNPINFPISAIEVVVLSYFVAMSRMADGLVGRMVLLNKTLWFAFLSIFYILSRSIMLLFGVHYSTHLLIYFTQQRGAENMFTAPPFVNDS